MKHLIITLLPLLLGCSLLTGEQCVDCISAALRISLIDSGKSTSIAGATVVAINQSTQDTTVIDSLYRAQWGNYHGDSVTVVYGIPGSYSLIITHPLYATFTTTGIRVTQWEEVTCDQANTENLIISLDKTPSGAGKK